MTLPCNRAERLDRALVSLEGLSVGDAFGDTYFSNPNVVENLVRARALARPPWMWTDDTAMAVSIVRILERHDRIDEAMLMADFAARYEPRRGYGPAMHGLLRAVRAGADAEPEAASLFGGQGSFGNGGAMRAAPLGAYFADDPEALVEQAILSARVTHRHVEGIAGTIAVAAAAGIATRRRLADGGEPLPSRADFIDQVLAHGVPDSEVRARLLHARDMSPGSSVLLAVARLGNGSRVSAQDTVPFCLWCAGEWLSDYEEALWHTVSGFGDRDTTCAIVGGIVACYTGVEGIPAAWREAREALPE
jgi:ADP-ribosylglycohydrolase